MTMGVRALAFNAEGELLLVKHTYVPGWHLCGGGVETGDTLAQTLETELREEANVVLDGPAVLRSMHLNLGASKRDHVAVLVAKNVTQTSPKQADREIKDARFFALDALPDDTTEATKRRLAEYFDGVSPDPYW